MPISTRDALQQMRLYTDQERYRFVHLPLNRVTAAAGVLAEISDPFLALLVDKDELTLVLTEGDLDDYRNRLGDPKVSDHAYRLITFDLALGEGVVGFMAAVSAALAAETISIMPLAAFNRDHLFVPADQFERAWSALDKLRTGGYSAGDN